MATTPKASQLEKLAELTPNTKAWIKALVAEAIAAIPAPKDKPVDLTSVHAKVDELHREVQYLRQKFEANEDYSLTKAKVIGLLKRNGIE